MMNHAKIYAEENLKHLFINRKNWKFEVVYDKTDLIDKKEYIFILSIYIKEEHNPENMKDGEGIEGILLSNGEFCYIPDKNHQRFANAIIDEYPEELHNQMVFLFNGSYRRIACIKEPTKEQWEWLYKYKNKLHREQISSLRELKKKIEIDLMPNLKDSEEISSLEWFRYGFAKREE